MLTLRFSPQAHTFPSSGSVWFLSSPCCPVGPLPLTLHRPDVSQQATAPAPRRGFPPEQGQGLGNVGSWKLTGIPLSQQDLFILLFKKIFFIEKGHCSHSETHEFFQVDRIEQRWSRVPSTARASSGARLRLESSRCPREGPQAGRTLHSRDSGIAGLTLLFSGVTSDRCWKSLV